MVDVFISYKHEDREAAEAIDRLLRAAGLSVWWDPSIRAGEYWDESIGNQLDTAKAVIVLWSEKSAASQWVKAEAITAFARGVLVSARIDDVALKFPFGVVQAADLRGWNYSSAHPGLDDLLAGVQAKAKRRNRKKPDVIRKPDQVPSVSVSSTSAIIEPAEWSTGLTDLDHLIGGLRPGNLLSLVGRASAGKSALAVTISLNVANQIVSSTKDAAVLYFSLESSAEDIASRMLAIAADFSAFDMVRARITEEEFLRLADAAEAAQELPLHVDEGVLSIEEIELAVLRFADEHPPALVVVDSAKMIDLGAANNSLRRALVRLKAMAKKTRTTILILSDVARTSDSRFDRRPTLADIDEAIEEISDCVLCLHREALHLEREEPSVGTDEHIAWMRQVDEIRNQADLLVLKQRQGPMGSVRLFYNPTSIGFGNLFQRD